MQTRFGPPEVVRVIEVDKPAPKDNELLIKVHATTVNRTDCGVRAARPLVARPFYGLVRPRWATLGNEFAGVVEAVGPDVTSYAVGDRVFGYNDRTFGAHAEYMVVRQDGWLATMPMDMAFEAVAPATEGSHYAWGCIRARTSKAGTTSWSTVPPARSARRPFSCSRASAPP